MKILLIYKEFHRYSIHCLILCKITYSQGYCSGKLIFGVWVNDEVRFKIMVLAYIMKMPAAFTLEKNMCNIPKDHLLNQINYQNKKFVDN